MHIFTVKNKGKTIVFSFNEHIQNQTNVTSVSIIGTFNEWQNLPNWQLKQKGNGLWELQVPAEKTAIPGNSGYAEWKFLVNGSIALLPLPKTPAGYTFKDNNIIIFPHDDTKKIAENEQTALRIKTLSDFDLSNENDRKIIANFRLVPGTAALFRSYNPCDFSKPHDAEVNRHSYVNEFIEKHRVKSIISLSGNYVPWSKEFPTTYVQNIIEDGHFLAIEPSYESVYYKSDSKEFALQFKNIVEFIGNPAHTPPFLVHCKIGTDRTGVVSALLAALCGASWSDISTDYQKSNEVGFQEYRAVQLLQYSLENMLKTTVSNKVDLKKRVSEYFIEKGYMTAKNMSELVAKLS